MLNEAMKALAKKIQKMNIQDLEMWDKKAILTELKGDADVRKERLQILKNQGVTHPLKPSKDYEK